VTLKNKLIFKDMKIKQLFLISGLLLVGVVFSETWGQSNIRALFKKCETLDDVSISRVRNRSEGSEKVITSVNFKNNPQLVQEFLDACKKDEAEATQIIEEKKGGKMVPNFYRFGNTTFTFSYRDDGASATLIDN